jgi:SpoVK/Ycf46/Vps4 family AAA+-type ATPase
MQNFSFNSFNSSDPCFINIRNEELRIIISIVTEDDIVNGFDALVKYAFGERLKEIKLLEIEDSPPRFSMGEPNVFNRALKPSAILSEAAFGNNLGLNNNKKRSTAKHPVSIMTKTNAISKYLPKISLKDVILPEEHKKKIEEFIWFYHNRQKSGWDLADLGVSGNSALFYGPPGTGKTMLAEALGGELKKEVAIVKYESLIDCWVGDSEKNVQSIFSQNRDANNVLLFDECDALLESRSDARDAVDKMNNRIINILLQELEKYPGIVVFTTNRAVALDPALERRIALKMEIGRPAKKVRKAIWKKMTAGKIPLENGINWDEIAEINLSGGEIKNALINLAKDPEVNRPAYKVNTADLLRSARMEVGSAFKDKKRDYGFKSQ